MISINMSMSLDGKIATKARKAAKFSSEYDTRRMAEIRAEHDMVLNGMGTFLVHPYVLRVNEPSFVEKRVANGLSEQPISALTSSTLEIPEGSKWEQDQSGVERWAFTGKNHSALVAERLEKSGIRIIKLPSERPGPQEISTYAHQEGVKNILLEGGGILNASFLEADLVDRIYLTMVPVIIGGDSAPTWVEGKGFEAPYPHFVLDNYEERGGEFYFVFCKKKK
ncbi:MAG: dihydrofolate reductase family protein [Oligoflexia bacterium]|nr:dihydrofolate reductase family protein [Oligoflexia bacterium]